MNQERRNKRNAQYKINLERRHGLTKKDDYIKQMSDGIEKSEERNPMDGHYEFTLTRNKKGDVITRNMFKYKWTAQAKAIQKLYHDTKNGIPEKPKKKLNLFFDIPHTKEEIKEHFKNLRTEKKVKLENREFSTFHHKLVEGLYLNKKEEVILQTAAAQGAHNAKIEAFMKKNLIKKGQEPLFKLAKKNNSQKTATLNIAA